MSHLCAVFAFGPVIFNHARTDSHYLRMTHICRHDSFGGLLPDARVGRFGFVHKLRMEGNKGIETTSQRRDFAAIDMVTYIYAAIKPRALDLPHACGVLAAPRCFEDKPALLSGPGLLLHSHSRSQASNYSIALIRM